MIIFGLYMNPALPNYYIVMIDFLLIERSLLKMKKKIKSKRKGRAG